MKYECPISPGDKVSIDGQIKGTVDQVIFKRGRTDPMVLVQWWLNGTPQSYEFFLEEVEIAE